MLETSLYESGVALNTKEEELKKSHTEYKQLLAIAASAVSYPDKHYIQATYVWDYLKNNIGLSDYVAAGIMGNIMVEVGGQTLDISKYSCGWSDNKEYYGICQWSKERKDRLFEDFGSSLEAQCKFLGVELFEIIPEDEEFYQWTDEKEVALYFAKNFERCGTRSYKLRQQCASKALEYFS